MGYSKTGFFKRKGKRDTVKNILDIMHNGIVKVSEEILDVHNFRKREVNNGYFRIQKKAGQNVE